MTTHALTLRQTCNALFNSPVLKNIGLQIGVFMLLLIGVTAPVEAQNSQSPTIGEGTLETKHLATWEVKFGAQAGRLLEEETSASTQESVLRTIVRMAQRRPSIDLSATIEPLLHVLETDSDSQHRLMAIQALHTIGAEQGGQEDYRRAMKRISTLMEEESSEQVRRVASACLESYVSDRAA